MLTVKLINNIYAYVLIACFIFLTVAKMYFVTHNMESAFINVNRVVDSRAITKFNGPHTLVHPGE